MLTCSMIAHAQPTDSMVVVGPGSLAQFDLATRQQSDPNGWVYAQANALGDYQTAIVALHYLLQKDPRNTFLQDSLAALYLRVGNTQACHRWCLEMLKIRPDAVYLLELVAGLEESQGNFVAALGRVEQVYRLVGGSFWRYRMTGLQFQLGRYGECGANIESMLSDVKIDAEAMHLTWEGGSGDIPLRAALLNLRGNLELALGKETLARKSFREALKLAPDFGLARNNLSALQTSPIRDEGSGR